MFIRGSTRFYEDGEGEISTPLAWSITALGIVLILKIAGLNLSNIFDILNSFANYLR